MSGINFLELQTGTKQFFFRLQLLTMLAAAVATHGWSSAVAMCRGSWKMDRNLLLPPIAGLQKLLDICQRFGIENDMIFNPKKTAVMFFKPSEAINLNHPDFILDSESISIVDEYKYLGYIICDNLSDKKDIDRHKRNIYAQGDTLIRKFSMCSLDVKIMLFRTYCTPMYCAQLWCRFKPSSNRRGALSKLYVAYHSILKILIGVSKYERNSPIFVHLNVPTCAAVIRNLIHKFKCRVDQSKNVILQSLVSLKPVE